MKTLIPAGLLKEYGASPSRFAFDNDVVLGPICALEDFVHTATIDFNVTVMQIAASVGLRSEYAE